MGLQHLQELVRAQAQIVQLEQRVRAPSTRLSKPRGAWIDMCQIIFTELGLARQVDDLDWVG